MVTERGLFDKRDIFEHKMKVSEEGFDYRNLSRDQAIQLCGLEIVEALDAENVDISTAEFDELNNRIIFTTTLPIDEYHYDFIKAVYYQDADSWNTNDVDIEALEWKIDHYSLNI